MLQTQYSALVTRRIAGSHVTRMMEGVSASRVLCTTALSLHAPLFRNVINKQDETTLSSFIFSASSFLFSTAQSHRRSVRATIFVAVGLLIPCCTFSAACERKPAGLHGFKRRTGSHVQSNMVSSREFRDPLPLGRRLPCSWYPDELNFLFK